LTAQKPLMYCDIKATPCVECQNTILFRQLMIVVMSFVAFAIYSSFYLLHLRWWLTRFLRVTVPYCCHLLCVHVRCCVVTVTEAFL